MQRLDVLVRQIDRTIDEVLLALALLGISLIAQHHVHRLLPIGALPLMRSL
jgi:hypothetical protein